MSYQLVVEFEAGRSPSVEDVQKILKGFDPNSSSTSRNVLQSTDPVTGGSLSIDLEQPNMVKLIVPYSATFRTVTAAYTVAWALADKFAGRFRDPQLGGPPSLDLARQEWRKHETDNGLARIFGGSIPNGLTTRIKQRRGMIRQEIEIWGAELEIRRRQRSRNVHYSLPILSLGPVQVNTVPNPRGLSLVLLGFLMIIIGLGVTGAGSALIGGFLDIGGIAVMASSLVVYVRYKRRVLLFPGHGGNLVLEAASPSKKEVEQFLSSIDRVRFALSRSQVMGSPIRPGPDSENMRVA